MLGFALAHHSLRGLRLKERNGFPILWHMGKLYTGEGWIIKVQGNEHPPVHVHVLHPNGKATITTDGTVNNTGVPARAIADALTWMACHVAEVEAEWARMNNPRKRSP
jgi:hypothetical protein